MYEGVGVRALRLHDDGGLVGLAAASSSQRSVTRAGRGQCEASRMQQQSECSQVRGQMVMTGPYLYVGIRATFLDVGEQRE